MGLISISIFLLSLYNSQHMYNTSFTEIEILQDLSTDYMQTRLLVEQTALMDDTLDIATANTTFQVYLTGINGDLNKLHAIASSPSMRQNYNKLLSAVQAYNIATAQRLQFAIANGATGLHNTDSSSSKTYAFLDTVIRNTLDQAKASAKADIANNIIYMVAGIAAIIACIIVGILLAIRFSKRITSSIRTKLDQITSAARKLADGRLEPLDIPDQSEFGVLAKAFQHIQITLTDMKADVDKLIQGCNEGISPSSLTHPATAAFIRKLLKASST